MAWLCEQYLGDFSGMALVEKLIVKIASLKNPILFFPNDFLGQHLISCISDAVLPSFVRC